MLTFPNKIFKNNVWLVCIILLLGFAAHSSMLPSTFKTLDDSISIIDNPSIRDFSNMTEIFKSSFFGSEHYYRPMVTLSFMVEYHLFGLRSFYYNLTNLLLHLSIAASVFFLVVMIINNRTTAFFTSLLFAIHPIQWEAVANIPGRAVLLSTFFTINAFCFYFLAKEKARTVICLCLSLLFFACGLLSKESAIMFPILLFSYLFLVEKNTKKYPLILPYFLIVLVYLYIRTSLGITEIYPWRSAGELFLGVTTFLRACLTYLRLLVWPVDLHFDRARVMFLTIIDPELWATISVYLISLFVLLRSRKRLTGAVIFFIMWVGIELLPVSQIITSIGVQPGFISAAEHFLYMPVIGAFVLVVLAVQKLLDLNLKKGFCSINACRALLAGFFLFLILGTVRQGFDARSALTMFRQTLTHNPRNVRVLYSMGIEMVNRKRFGEAEQYFRKALYNDPLHLVSHIALGRAMYDQGKYTESIAVYEAVDQAGRWDQLLAENLDDAYQGAIEQYKLWIKSSPNNAQLYYSLGTVYSRSDRIEEGIEQYELALSLDPAHKNVLFNLATSYEALGEEDRAVTYYERMVAIDGQEDDLDAFTYNQLGEIYRRQGNEARAQEYFSKLKY